MSEASEALAQRTEQRPGTVRARLHFTPPMVAVPTLDITGNNRGHLKLEGHDVEIADADALSPRPTLATHGFEAVPFAATPPPEGSKPSAQFRSDFATLCVAAVRKATGARTVFGVPSSVQIRRSHGVMEEAAISVVHTDFTPSSAMLRVRQAMAMAGYTERVNRFAAYNTWWLMREGPQDRPLALCDATSIAPPDIQYGRAHVLSPEATDVDYGTVAFQRYNPKQRWYFYPNLAPDRMLVFCGFDSNADFPSMATHTAFMNSECPPDAPPRVSIESRCFAVW